MDDTPGDVIDDGVVSAGTVKSLFQTGNVGLRVTYDVSWGLRSSSAVAWIENTNW